MLILLVAFLVGAVTASLPWMMPWVSRYLPALKLDRSPKWLPFLAGCLFFGSFFLPDIHISADTNTFQQHFIGGGVYTACLYVYFQQLFGWRWAWWLSLLGLFAFVSMLGVTNELLELVVTKLHIVEINLMDADWDLLANTTGALVGYALLTSLANKRTKA